jgi:hypothetical protein
MAYHESFMEVRSQKVIDKLLRLLIFCATGLIFEHHIVIPSETISDFETG